MALCTAASLLLKPAPSLPKSQQSSPATTGRKPAFCRAKAAGGDRSRSPRQAANAGRSVGEKEADGLVMGRRQAMASLMAVAAAWATPAPAAPDVGDRILEKEPLRLRVRRPRRQRGEEGKEEVLTVRVRVARGEAVGFNVFLNLPDARSDTPVSSPQFAGTFFNVPNRLPHKPYRDTQLRIGVSDIIKELGLSDDAELLVSIVPNPAVLPAPILIKAVTLQLE